jgi:hypothetical protein
MNASTPEPAPVARDTTPIWDLVTDDLRVVCRDRCLASITTDCEARNAFGIAKYGTPLQADNGRRPLVDAYQEALDLAVYLRQAMAEGHGVADEYYTALQLVIRLSRLTP